LNLVFRKTHIGGRQYIIFSEMTKGQPTSPEARGYRRLADFMAWDTRAAIFPRFQSANMLNLLSLQVEVCQLQEELVDMMNEDDKSLNERKWYATNLQILMRSEEGQSQQWLKMQKLREKLNEYSK
jgi:hypothetical protein